MAESDDSAGSRDQQRPDDLGRVLRDLSHIIESGRRIDTEEYLKRYPELSPRLKEFFRTHGVDDGETVFLPGLGVGSTLDDYRIVREIGRGGMGMVYEAEQMSLDRRVALKVLPSNALRNQRAIDRFKREATAVARLSHPRIVAVHGFSHSGEAAYLAMELVSGLDLAEIIDRLRSARTHGRRFVMVSGPHMEDDIADWAKGRKLMGTVPGDPRMSEGVVIDLRNYAHMAAAMAADAADALRHAHAHGIIHRDIKPSNLMLGGNGRIKLSDFGLAKSVKDLSLTKTGDFVGSPAYVSPEQASSRRTKVDERSDLYSLGVTMYEFLTLHQPFAGKDVADVLRKIITKDPPKPTRLNPRIPRDLETIVMKAIEKDPEKRYPSAEEMGADLRRFLNYEPISARPLGLLARSLRSVRRHWIGWTLSGMAATIVLLALALWTDLLSLGADDPSASQALSITLGGNGASNPATVDALELVQLAELSPLERQERVKQVAADADGLLAEGKLDEVSEMLERLDTKLAFAGLAEVDTQLLQNNLRETKVGLIHGLLDSIRSGNAPNLAREREWLAVLERLVNDPDRLVCKNAAFVLGELHRPSSLGALLDALSRRTDTSGRVSLIRALGELGEAGAAPYLAESARDADPEVRLAVLEALLRLDPPDLEVRILPFAGDGQSWLRARYESIVAARRTP